MNTPRHGELPADLAENRFVTAAPGKVVVGTDPRATPLSVVIPSYQRSDHLRDTVADLDQQNLSVFECLVILQTELLHSELDDLHAALRSKLRVLYVAEPNASLARNIGLREARGEIVLFLDDDVRLPDPGFLAAHLRNFENAMVAGVYGQVLKCGGVTAEGPEPAVIETDWGWRLLPANYARRCRTRNGGSGNLAVRRDWAIAVGGMDAWFERGARREETEFNLRYTQRFGPLVFDPEARLIHLSAGGGSRAWGHVRKTVPMHHIVGHWYFWLRALKDRTEGVRGLVLELRFIAVALLRNPQTGWSPLAFAQNAARALWGLAIALRRVLHGPRRLDTLEPSVYQELTLSATVEQAE